MPIILLNGSEGLSTGFSQLIYPRNPQEIISYIIKRLNGIKKIKSNFLPYYKKFLGTFKYNNENILECWGKVEKINTTNYIITELPIGIEYSKYIEILDKLCDLNIIQDYTDKCNPQDDSIKFEIKTTREFTAQHSNEKDLYETFKLIKTCPEQYNCIDEFNRIREFNSIQEILDAYIDIRLNFYKLRKEYILKSLKYTIHKEYSKYIFIKGINDKTIKINNVPKISIIKQLEKNLKIIKINESYDYLLSIPLYSITKEKIDNLKKLILELKNKYSLIKDKSIKDLWLDDLKEFRKKI